MGWAPGGRVRRWAGSLGVLGALLFSGAGVHHARAEAAGPQTGSGPEDPVGDETGRPPVEAPQLFQDRGILTRRGELVLEPSLEFAHSSVQRVALEGFTFVPAITIGHIDIRRVRRDAVITALAVRYGLTRRLEVEAEVPYVWRQDSVTARPLDVTASRDETHEVSGWGLGDLEMSGRYQLNRGTGGWPYLVANLRVKTATGTSPFHVPTHPRTGLQEELPTGSGFWGVQPSLTAVLPSDPAVLYGNLSYLWNQRRQVSGFGEIDPGNALGLSLGLGLGLNDKLSVSFGYQHSVVGRTELDGAAIEGSDTYHLGALLVGVTYRRRPDRSVTLSVALGVTEDSPDVRVVLRTPFPLRTAGPAAP